MTRAIACHQHRMEHVALGGEVGCRREKSMRTAVAPLCHGPKGTGPIPRSSRVEMISAAGAWRWGSLRTSNDGGRCKAHGHKDTRPLDAGQRDMLGNPKRPTINPQRPTSASLHHHPQHPRRACGNALHMQEVHTALQTGNVHGVRRCKARHVQHIAAAGIEHADVQRFGVRPLHP